MSSKLFNDWFATEKVRRKYFSHGQRQNLSQYPEWVPTFTLQKIARNPDLDTDRFNILNLLCTHPNMEVVWRRLHKRDLAKNFPTSRRLPEEVYHALHGYNSSVESLTPSQRKIESEKLRKAFLELVSNIEKYDLDRSCLLLIDTQEVDTLLPDLAPLDREFVRLESPLMSELLRRMAKELETQPLGTDYVIGSKTKDDDQTRLIRHLGMFFKKRYGDALVENVSLIVEAFFHIRLDDAAVRRSIATAQRLTSMQGG